MAGEDVTLREYVEAMFAEREKAVEAALASQEKAVSAALEASDKAISKAEAEAEKWRANANEWRGAMSDRDRELPSRREVDTAVAALDVRIGTLERLVQAGASRSEGAGSVVAYIIGGGGVLVGIVGLVVSQI